MLYGLKPVVQPWHPPTCWCTYPGLYQAWAGKVIQTILLSTRLLAPLQPVQQYWQQKALNTLQFIHQHSTSQACCGYHELKFQTPLNTPLQMEIAWSTAHNCSCTHVSWKSIQNPSLHSSHLSRQVQQQALRLLEAGRVFFIHCVWCLAQWGPLISLAAIISYFLYYMRHHCYIFPAIFLNPMPLIKQCFLGLHCVMVMI